MPKNKLRIGTGGIPISTKNRTTEDGLARLRELGLDHLELEFVHSVYIKEDKVESIATAAAENDISLTAHGSYYINLASKEKPKWHAGINRLASGAYIGQLVGVKSITFHSAFNQNQPRELVMEKVKEGITKAIDSVDEKLAGTTTKSWGKEQILISPELTGKKSQFGSIHDLIDLLKVFKGSDYEGRVNFCVDFAHKYARNGGEFATETEFREFFDLIVKELGEEALGDMHMHFSAIEYGDKGEKNHLTFLSSYEEYKDLGIDIEEVKDTFSKLAEKNRLGGCKQDWRALLKVMKEYGVGGYLVCESPILEMDALLLQQTYDSF